MRKQMKSFIAVLSFALLTAFSGCVNQPTTAPVIDRAEAQRAVFAAKEGYGVSVRLATAYAALQRCKVPRVLPCSDQAVVDQITRARNIARDALSASQAVVDNPIFGNDAVSTAIIAAQASLKAFESIANQPGVK